MSFKLGSSRLRLAVDLEVKRHKLNFKLPDKNAHRTYNIYSLNENVGRIFLTSLK